MMNALFKALLLLIAVCSLNIGHLAAQSALIESLHYTTDKPVTLISAHRGGRFVNNFPENAIPTFNYTLQKTPGALIELDVSISRDSVLFLMHDMTLDRTTTLTGKNTDAYWSAIRNSYLVDDFDQITPFHPSSFKDALKWAKRKGVILVVDTKRDVPYRMVLDEIEEMGMASQVIMTTYESASARYIYNKNKGVVISANIRNMEEWRRFQYLQIPTQNIVAFTGTIESSEELIQTLHDNGILCIIGTMGNLDKKAEAKGEKVYQKLKDNGYDIFATDYPTIVKDALK